MPLKEKSLYQFRANDSISLEFGRLQKIVANPIRQHLNENESGGHVNVCSIQQLRRIIIFLVRLLYRSIQKA